MKSVFGHCITDDIKRLWFIGTEKYKELRKQGVKCVYILPEDDRLSPVLEDIISWLGENINDWERVTTETRYNQIYIPECSLLYDNGERLWTKEFRDTVIKIKNAVVKKSARTWHYDKVYMSRTRFSEPSREMGEKAIEEAFANLGDTM